MTENEKKRGNNWEKKTDVKFVKLKQKENIQEQKLKLLLKKLKTSNWKKSWTKTSTKFKTNYWEKTEQKKLLI